MIFSEILAHEGVREVCELRGSLGFMAYHGGALEEMTDVIASAAAELSGASYYGVLQPPDLQWHIPSHHVRPDESLLLAKFFQHVDTVITIHGYGRAGFFTSLLLGGQIDDSLRTSAVICVQHFRPTPSSTQSTIFRPIFGDNTKTIQSTSLSTPVCKSNFLRVFAVQHQCSGTGRDRLLARTPSL